MNPKLYILSPKWFISTNKNKMENQTTIQTLLDMQPQVVDNSRPYNPNWPKAYKTQYQTEFIVDVFLHRLKGKFTFKKEKDLYELMDGKQRLTAILKFVENEFSFEGKTFSQHDAELQKNFLSCPIEIEFSQVIIKKHFKGNGKFGN